ncbi:hypothetical protein [Microbacterium sp. YY-01]|uniref:hypothetical protein n=1 Tax=Microbacterium sp. YY-01 TaxID=3421634 RepID=UPI003D185265
MSDDGLTPQRVLQTQHFEVTQVDTATATLSVTIAESVADRIDAPFVVRVEYATGFGYVSPRNGLFMLDEYDGDDADATGTVKFTGVDFVSWKLARTYHHWKAGAKDGARVWSQGGQPVSAGFLMAGLLTESKARGWGSEITHDFTGTTDSLGQTWEASDKILEAWPLLKPLSNILSQLTEQGLCDWWTEGTQLRLARAGSGDLRENIVLGGPQYNRRPVRGSFSNVFTNLTVVPEKSSYWLYLQNEGASTRFGRLESTMTQSGIASHMTATRLAQPTLTRGRAMQHELSFDWVPDVAGYVPWTHFQVGDTVYTKSRTGKTLQRVIGIQVSRSGNEAVKVRVVTGDKLVSLAARQAKRLGAGSIGDIVGGTGDNLPPSPGYTFAEPVAPTGLHVASNVGEWRADGSAKATVTIGWDAVSQSVDGSDVDVEAYEVASRLDHTDPVIFATTNSLTVTVDDWEPGVTRLVKVRARASGDRVSDWTIEVPVTPQMPSSIIPKAPEGLTELYNVAGFLPGGRPVAYYAIQWTPVTQSTDGDPVVVTEYEVFDGFATHRTAGNAHSGELVPGETVALQVRAISNRGVYSDFSDLIMVTGATPDGLTDKPSTPILSTDLGLVNARWDGLIGGAVPPDGFGYVYMDVAPSEDGPWQPFGTPLTGAGGANVRPTVVGKSVGDDLYIRFRMSDTLGRPGPVSDTASILVEGIDGPDIKANAVDANHVRAGSISVNHVEPSFGDELDITANSSINFIVGRQDDQEQQLVDLDGAVHDAADAAGQAQSSADGAQASADDTAARLDTHQTYYRFGADGLSIGDPNGDAELRLKPARIEMVQNGVVGSYWEGGVFVADETRLKRSLIGNHRFEEYGPGRTIVRPI